MDSGSGNNNGGYSGFGSYHGSGGGGNRPPSNGNLVFYNNPDYNRKKDPGFDALFENFAKNPDKSNNYQVSFPIPYKNNIEEMEYLSSNVTHARVYGDIIPDNAYSHKLIGQLPDKGYPNEFVRHGLNCKYHYYNHKFWFCSVKVPNVVG